MRRRQLLRAARLITSAGRGGRSCTGWYCIYVSINMYRDREKKAKTNTAATQPLGRKDGYWSF